MEEYMKPYIRLFVLCLITRSGFGMGGQAPEAPEEVQAAEGEAICRKSKNAAKR